MSPNETALAIARARLENWLHTMTDGSGRKDMETAAALRLALINMEAWQVMEKRGWSVVLPFSTSGATIALRVLDAERQQYEEETAPGWTG